MKWTTKPPTQPGWYFWRWRKSTMRVFHVAPRKNGRLGYGVCKGSASCLVHDDDDEEWAGPIPEPEEADA